jgi:hypothetical protein
MEMKVKKLLTAVSLMVFVNVMAAPVFAQPYRGYRMGPGMMGEEYSTIESAPLDEEKLKAYDEELAGHYTDTANQRQDIIVKQHEMATLLVDSKTTRDELIAKQKELQELVNALQREELVFRWDLHKKYPEMSPDIYGGCLAPAAGYGDGAGMMDYGSYGRDMMNSDDYKDHGYRMRGYGRRNWNNRSQVPDTSTGVKP